MAQGGVGWWANRWWHPNWWHPEWWAEQGAAVIYLPLTAGGALLTLTALGETRMAATSLGEVRMTADALGDWVRTAVAGDDVRLRMPYHD